MARTEVIDSTNEKLIINIFQFDVPPYNRLCRAWHRHATVVLGRVMTEIIPAFAVGYVLVMSTLGTVLMGESDRVARFVFREPESAVVG